jgi:hypothetical protein
MFNVLVGFPEGEAFGSRVLEATEKEIREYVSTDGLADPLRLMSLPTLVMPEIGIDDGQSARVGHIEDLKLYGSSYRFRFVPNPAMPEIPLPKVQAMALRLGINNGEFRRTHWAVKAGDLYWILHEELRSSAPSNRLLRFPVERSQEADLVAVIMSFDAKFNPVYEALRDAATDAGLRCMRADDIWINHHIMDDVASLIWRSQVVIADLTGRNPNVFYETGIAHSLGRDVIQITQSTGDVPFDLRAIRSIDYLPNGEGLKNLRDRVAARLTDLIGRGADPRS